MLEELVVYLVDLNNVDGDLVREELIGAIFDGTILYLIERFSCLCWIRVYKVDLVVIGDQRLKLDRLLCQLSNIFIFLPVHSLFLASVMSAEHFLIFYIQ